MAWWAWLWARISDGGNFPGTEAWRARRASLAKHQAPTYDVYPDRKFEPEMRLYVEARDAKGRLRREVVDLSGYSLHQVNLTSRRWRDGVAERIAEARYLLAVKLDEVARATESS